MNTGFFAQARDGRGNSVARYAIGLVVIVTMTVLLSSLLLAVAGPMGRDPIRDTLVALTGIAFLGLGVAVVSRLVHRRTVVSFFSPDGRIRSGLVLRSALIWGAHLLLLVGVLVAAGALPTPTFDRGLLLFVAAALPVLLAQVTGEELMFRSYLGQGLFRLTGSLAAMAVIQAAVFASLHGAVHDDSAWTARFVYFTLGMFLFAVTWRADRLEPAIGIHLAQNCVALFLIGGTNRETPSLLAAGPPETTSTLLEGIAAALLVTAMASSYWILAFRTGLLGLHDDNGPGTSPGAVP